MEDGGFLRTADVCSPLPFPAQYHSTPNYWDTRASEKPVVHASGAASQNTMDSCLCHILESTTEIEIKRGTYIDVNKRKCRRQEQ